MSRSRTSYPSLKGKIQVVSHSDTGRVRDHNEDAAAADAFCRLYADRLFFPQRAVSPALSLWRRAPGPSIGQSAGRPRLEMGTTG